MHYAVELYFDSQLERAVAAVRSILAQAGLPTPERYGPEARPHVSLTGYDGPRVRRRAEFAWGEEQR